MWKIVLFYPYFTDEKTEYRDIIYNFPKTVQLGIGKAKVWTQAMWLQSHALSHYVLLCSCALSL